MKILLASLEFETLTGQPIYNYHIAKGLKELGHKVVCVGMLKGQPMEAWFKTIDVPLYSFKEEKWRNGDYDLAVINEDIAGYLQHIKTDNVWNFCHSKNSVDQPIRSDNIRGYLVPRLEVAERWGIDAKIFPIPIDPDRFKPLHIKQDKYTILAPCTFESLRMPMLEDLSRRADSKTDVWLVNSEKAPFDNLKVLPPTSAIELYMAKADEVAGIFEGTVTFEGWYMGKKCSVYDENGHWKYVDPPKDLHKHDYLNVAKQYLDLI